MPLDSAVEYLLTEFKNNNAPEFQDLGVDGARSFYRAMNTEVSEAELDDVYNLTVPVKNAEVSIRVYQPKSSEPCPVVMYFHGGGWVIGDLNTHDSLCRELAYRTKAIVVAVDYRLAPEHPYPVATEDCYAATLFVAENASKWGGDASRLALAGDSAGGNLVAVVSQMIRDLGGPSICFQLLFYPVTDGSCERDSHHENGEGYLLTTRTMRWFWDQYCPVEKRHEVRASPLLAQSLAGLPPTLVITAEFDILRDEGKAYGKALEDAGVKVESRCYDGVIHGFVHMYGLLPRGEEALQYAVKSLQKALA